MKQKFLFSLLILFSFGGFAQSISLLTPLDEQANVSSYPVFSWQLIGSSYPALTYTFKIAEYNLSIGDAASLASPIYSTVINDNSNFISFNYPTTLQPLETCKQYVWQVIANYTIYTTQEPIVPNGNYSFISPYYHLSSTCNTNTHHSANRTISPTYPIYLNLAKTVDNFVYLITTDSLYFKYKESYNNNSRLTYKIYSTEENVVKTDSLQIAYGLNYLAIDITNGTILDTPKIYTLEIKTPKGEILRAKFEKKPI